MSKTLRQGDTTGLKNLFEAGDISEAHYEILKGQIESRDVVVELIESTWGEIAMDNVVQDGDQ